MSVPDIMPTVEKVMNEALRDQMDRMYEIANGMSNHYLNVRIAEVGDEPLKTWAGMNMRVSVNMKPYSLQSGGGLSITIDGDTKDLGRLEPLRDRIEAMVAAIEQGVSDDLNNTAAFLTA